MKKTMKKNIIITILAFCTVLIIQNLYIYGIYYHKTIELEETVYFPRNEYNSSYTFEIQIIKPDNDETIKHPAVILLHGDAVNSKSMNMIKRELLRNGFYVVLLDVQYYSNNIKILTHLNSTLNFLLDYNSVNSSQIGIIGHSHGAHLALLFSSLRNESISATICANYGPYTMMIDDYMDFFLDLVEWNTTVDQSLYSNFIKYPDWYNENFSQYLPDNLRNFSPPFIESPPQNLLLLTDTIDDRSDRTPEIMFNNITAGKYSTESILYGSFNNGSARELFVTTSIYGHASGIWNPKSINKEILWLNSAFSLSGSNLVYTLTIIDSIIMIILIVSEFGIGFYLISRFYSAIKFQDQFLKDIKLYLIKKGIIKSNSSIENCKNDTKRIITEDCDDKDDSSLIQYTEKIKFNQESEEEFNKSNNIHNIKSLLKKFIIGIVILNAFIFFVVSIYPFALFYLKDFPILREIISILRYPTEILYDLGLNISYYQINDSIPFHFVIYTMFFLLIFINRDETLKKEILKPLKNMTFGEAGKGLIIGLEMIIIALIIIESIIYATFGDIQIYVLLNNAVISYITLYIINKLVKIHVINDYIALDKHNSKIFVKVVIISIIFYLILMIPNIIFYGINFDILIFLSLAIINPIIYRHKLDENAITWFDFFLFNFLRILI